MTQPTQKQLDYAKSLGIEVPANATKESVRNLIQEKLNSQEKPVIPVERPQDSFRAAREAKNVPMYVSYCKDLITEKGMSAEQAITTIKKLVSAFENG